MVSKYINYNFLCLCVYIFRCVSICVCVYICVHVGVLCVEIRGQLWVSFFRCPPSCFRDWVFHWAAAHWQDRWPDNEFWGSTCLPFPDLGFQAYATIPSFLTCVLQTEFLSLCFQRMHFASWAVSLAPLTASFDWAKWLCLLESCPFSFT